MASDDLLRVRKKVRLGWLWADLQALFFGRRAKGTMALKLEYKLAMVSFALLNALLLAVNITDIVYVWFNRVYQPGFQWVAFVHEGAWMLVFSIWVAMLVVLFFFRGNLNFMWQNGVLRSLTLLWIVQNFILCISVGIRNFYYIQHMGLAYKRIGLLFYLLLVAVGLITIIIKVYRKKTMHFLLRVNGWVAFTLLVFSSLVNWDLLIVNYNLKHRGSVPIDVEFLLDMHPSVIPVLEANAQALGSLGQPLRIGGYTTTPNANWVLQELQFQKERFVETQARYSWLSWNLADQQLHQYLHSKTPQ
ncbi:MAG: DUF4173 domain-containing protein [Bacteroidetes bacterium]|nr:MAG: DUF4173 domain-containing protein [Bacteroidota bacterium]